MERYDVEEIKSSISCLDYARRNGAEINGEHSNAFWRNGDGKTAVHYFEDGKMFKDHAHGSSGDIFELWKLVNGDAPFEIVNNKLGKELGLKPIESFGSKEVSKVISEHIYTDEKGNQIHKVLRYEPKSFKQFSLVDNEWRAGLDHCDELYPLYLQDIVKSDTIYINEGEKACDACKSLGYTSTTFVMGSGKWKESYKKWFKGKNIVIIPDNDDAGSDHARKLTWNLRDVAKSIKIAIISKDKKGDFADFVESGGTKKQSDEIIKKSTNIDLKNLKIPEEIIFETLKNIARKKNETSFTNYIVDFVAETKKDRKTGVEVTNKKAEFEAKLLKEMVNEVHERMMDYPRCLGGTLFDYDFKTNEIIPLRDPEDLMTRIAIVTKHNPDFKTLPASINKDKLFRALITESKYKYESSSKTPYYPKRESVFCPVEDLPEPSKDGYWLDKFVDFFNPASISDRYIMKSAICTMFWFDYMKKRPVFIIDTAKGCGQGTGKTTFVEMLGYLCGESPLSCTQDEVRSQQGIEEIKKRLLSSAGRQKKIFLLDNVTGFFDSAALSDFITKADYSGRPSYGKGEESRVNDLCYFITVNNGSFGKDITDRAILIEITKPKKINRNWDSDVIEFIDSYRNHIISDVIHLLETGNKDLGLPITRFKTWEPNVLQPVVNEKDSYESVKKYISTKRKSADGEAELAHEILNHIIEEISKHQKDPLSIDNKSKINPDKDVVWIKKSVLQQWILDVKPEFRSGAIPKLKVMIHTLSNSVEDLVKMRLEDWLIGDFLDDDVFANGRYPHKKQDDGTRPFAGMMFNHHKYKNTKNKSSIKIYTITEPRPFYDKDKQY